MGRPRNPCSEGRNAVKHADCYTEDTLRNGAPGYERFLRMGVPRLGADARVGVKVEPFKDIAFPVFGVREVPILRFYRGGSLRAA